MISLKSFTKSPPKLFISTLGVLIVVVAVLELTNTTHIFHKQKVNYGSGNIPASSSSNTINSSESPVPDSNPKLSSGTTTTTGGQTAPPSTGGGPASPYGYFVSNHKPGQNGTNTTEQSVCKTTPSSTCYIAFTNGSVVKTLETKTVDDSGTAAWSWDVRSAGLLSGSWKVTAVAGLNGQTVSSDDPILLEVQ